MFNVKYSILEIALSQNKAVFSKESTMEILKNRGFHISIGKTFFCEYRICIHRKKLITIVTVSFNEIGTDPVMSSKCSLPSVK